MLLISICVLLPKMKVNVAQKFREESGHGGLKP